MKHKNAEVLIALAEGKKIEWSMDTVNWHEYLTLDKRANPLSQDNMRWRVYTPPPIPVDTPVWVRDQPTHEWKPRHAAGPGHAWSEGCTSHTVDHSGITPSCPWRYITTERPVSLNSETTES